jgi:hypothetical protein
MIGPGVLLLLAFPAVFGMPLGGVGLVLRMCEWTRGKPAGRLGSTRLLLASALLCLPVVAYAVWAAVANTVRFGSPL